MKKVYLILIFFTISLNAQSTYDFLRITASPRAEALAGGFLTINDDPNVIFFNPAGIYSLTDNPVSFSYMSHIANIKFYNAVYSQQISTIGRFAFGIQYSNYGDFIEADAAGNKLGTFGANEMAIIIGYSREIMKNLFVGSNVKFIYSGIQNYSSTAIGFDFGAQYFLKSLNLRFGCAVTNLGTQLTNYSSKKENLPFDIQLGVAKKLEHLPLQLFVTLKRLGDTSIDFSKRLQYFTVAAELNTSKSFSIRIGYDASKRKDLKIATTTGLAGFNVGIGLMISTYRIDYAFSSLGEIGSINRIGISTKF